MSISHYLFSFGGRINRAKQWAVLLVGFASGILFQVAFAVLVGWDNVIRAIKDKAPLADFLSTPGFHNFLIACVVISLIWTYIHLAVMTKRLHDRDKGAIWLLVFFVAPIVLNIPRYMEVFQIVSNFPAFVAHAQEIARSHSGEPPFQETPLALIGGGAASIIGLWAFVELFCLRGTVGDNRYGPDPLAGRV